MCSVFSDHGGLILIDFFPRGGTVNSEKYQVTFKNLLDAIKRKRPEKLTKGVILHHDNASDRLSNWIFLVGKIDYSLYSSNMVWTDYHLFAKLKENLGVSNFPTRTNVNGEQNISFKTWIRNFTKRYHARINVWIILEITSKIEETL